MWPALPTQGVVDRQRPLTAPWLGWDLPAALTDRARRDSGSTPDRLETTWPRALATNSPTNGRFAAMHTPPKQVGVDVVGAKDIRVDRYDRPDFCCDHHQGHRPRPLRCVCQRPCPHGDAMATKRLSPARFRSKLPEAMPCRAIEACIVFCFCWPCGASSRPRPSAQASTFLRDVAPILNKTGCTSGPLPRRGQGQERIQALAARLRSAIRLRSAALRSLGPPLQSRRPRPQPDAGQAHAAGGPRRRTSHSTSARRITRPSITGSLRASRSAIPPRIPCVAWRSSRKKSS